MPLSLAVTLPAPRAQSSAAALATPLCSSPPSIPAPFRSSLLSLSLFSALAMRSLSSSLLPSSELFRCTLPPLFLLILVWVFPYVHHVQLLFAAALLWSTRPPPRASQTAPR